MNEGGGIIRQCQRSANLMLDRRSGCSRRISHQMRNRAYRQSHERGNRRIHGHGDFCDGSGLHLHRRDHHDQYRTRNAYPIALQRETLQLTSARE